jgi:hypothetical protein
MHLGELFQNVSLELLSLLEEVQYQYFHVICILALAKWSTP